MAVMMIKRLLARCLWVKGKGEGEKGGASVGDYAVLTTTV